MRSIYKSLFIGYVIFTLCFLALLFIGGACLGKFLVLPFTLAVAFGTLAVYTLVLFIRS